RFTRTFFRAVSPTRLCCTLGYFFALLSRRVATRTPPRFTRRYDELLSRVLASFVLDTNDSH
ncbi:MAG TPA: hypothetical protein VH164_14625, partial [Ktedonobacteraceae bacterium]|nr:hypothetical protein [Ktedonobacteraceae bacterium]